MVQGRRAVARRYLLDVAGSHRNEERNHHLALLLTVIAGMLNSVGFVAVAIYTSHMTGLVASTADNLVIGAWAVVRISVAAVVAFVLGAAVCALLFNWGRRRHRRARYANVLVLEAMLILLFGLLADQLTWEHRHWVYVPTLGFTMGLQNAIITKISDSQIRTTHVTGMVTDIGIELGKMAYRNRTRDLDPVRGSRRRLWTLTSLVGGFFMGNVVGAIGYTLAGFVVLVPAALVLLVAAVPPLLSDLRHRGEGSGDAGA